MVGAGGAVALAPPAADGCRAGVGCEVGGRFGEPAAIELAVAVDELDELERRVSGVERFEARVARAGSRECEVGR